MSLEGKSVVVTGGFGSLGAAVAVAARAAGANVAVVDRAPDAQAPAALAGLACFGGVDLGSLPAAEAAFQTIAEKLGGIDALVNIAGGFRWEPIESGKLETWDLLYNLNVKTALCASKAALPHLLLRGAGRIVNIGAAGAIKAGMGMGAYAASKAGVAKLTEALAEELKDRGITVNALLPSIIDTAPNRADMPDADFSRWVQPRQLADIIVFLLSDAASAITGALIPVTGRV
ncbi:MAG: Dehydrogenase [Hydrocarboniphaga sp.]|uniref:SDR family NAD(P)-dependent oxidoreductase n=1 Tax=Hydrocarboniphaga sp. TaxID=2033016 RepID=UPI002608BD48|nr:SDR family NAD(P)-dependent oxidoreductase [Hydrocarboniphaga sp.]MDB5973099.1 Dehydrogenase [Hydrocarboniphaga sp.]